MNIKKILVVRNDKLGDFMLAFPAFLLLKKAFPNSNIHALVPSYTRDMATVCGAIDDILIDPGPRAGLKAQWQLLRALKSQHYDAVITLYSTTRIGALAACANIAYRCAPATKIAQLFYNRRLKQRRSLSAKPEYEYNLDLGEFFIRAVGGRVPERPTPPYLSFPDDQISRVREAFFRRHALDPGVRLVFVHPGSGGSASNLTIDQYATLVSTLALDRNFRVVISAGPYELKIAGRLAAALTGVDTVIYHSIEGLVQFAQHIACASLFISGSTGPLHVAGALDVPTAGFYPLRQSATSLRWQTLNSPERRLAFSPPPETQGADLSAIDLKEVAESIRRRLL